MPRPTALQAGPDWRFPIELQPSGVSVLGQACMKPKLSIHCGDLFRFAIFASLLSVISFAPATAQSPVRTIDGDGRTVVRATRLVQPIAVDGQLDEAVYGDVAPITEFFQQEPIAGAPITERTEVWVFFDDENIYFACRCWDEHPERIVANDMRRDSLSLVNHDSISFAFSTFNDLRNGFFFALTPAGARRDGTTTEERGNFDWNPVWDGRASRFEEGWIAEMAIPFKSLRYRPGREQSWGLQVRRNIRSKNEFAYLTPVPQAMGFRAIQRFSDAATLVGLEAPPPGLHFEMKPYLLSSVTTDHVSTPVLDNDLDADFGIDLKYGLTEGLTADFTYNADFAQVEADEAQVNLTRFSLLFPEKRDFFLEGKDIFDFGNLSRFQRGNDVPNIFYTRRIGLSGTRVVPVIAGGRLSGKVGPWSVGVLNIETKAEEAADVAQTNFTVLRLRRDVLRRSNIGGLFTRRSVSTVAPGDNLVWGVDGNFWFYENVALSGYLAQSRTEDAGDNDLSYRAQFDYGSDRYGLELDRLVVGDDFNPEVGLLRREDFRRNTVVARFSPRTSNHPRIRKWTYEGSLDYVTDNDNRLESRNLRGLFQIDFHNSDSLSLEYTRLYEFLAEPFDISDTATIPAGGYGFDNLAGSYRIGAQHRLSGSTSFEVGRFYNGDKKTAGFRGRLEVTPQLSVEPTISLNWIDLPDGRFTNNVTGARTTFTVTPRMFVGALVQYSSANTSLSTNVRFRWEYQPGSELIVVYSEGRSTLPPRGTELENRGFIAKINRLIRF